MSTKEITQVTEVDCGEARLSPSQPEHVGFGFVLHFPARVCSGIPISKLKELFRKGMVAEEKQPLFLRTEQKFVRMSFHYGDQATACAAYNLFSSHTRLIFKNWI